MCQPNPQPAAPSRAPRFPRPAWFSFAGTAALRLQDYFKSLQASADAAAAGNTSGIDQLLAAEAGEEAPSSGTACAGGSALLKRLSDHPEVRHLPPDLWQALAAQGADPFACDDSGRNLPDTHMPARHLLLALRLAAAFGTRETVEAQLQRGAVTILRGIAPADYEILGRVLAQAILPEGWASFDPRRTAGLPNRVTLAQPRAHDDRPAPRHLEELRDLVSAGLMHGQPLWVVLPDEADLPEPLLAEHCTELLLPVPDPDLLIAFLRASHSRTGRIDEAATRAALPPAEQLRELPAATLAFALRAPTAVQAAQRLAQSLAAPEAAPARPAPEEPAEITGTGPVYDTARRLVADLRLWSEGGIAWNEIPHSLLLHGKPGTGKSHLARAMGRSAGVNCIEASCAGWQSAGHLGDMLREMRHSFSTARKQAPCILFIDEIDAIGCRTSGDKHGASYRRQVVNGFLEMMDRISREDGVMVVGACNHPQHIDAAVLRAGRFDLKLEVPLPDTAMLQQLLAERLGSELSGMELRQLAHQAIGKTAADIDAAVRSARSAARHDRVPLGLALRQHLDLRPVQETSALLRRVAIHECGHAIAAQRFGATVTRIAISPEGGFTERSNPPREGLAEDFEQELAVYMAGRAAERLLLGDVSAGAGGGPQSDIALATRLILECDRRLGLGVHGHAWMGEAGPACLSQDERARVIVSLNAAEDRAAEILTEHRLLLEEMASELVRLRELSGEDAKVWLMNVEPANALTPE